MALAAPGILEMREEDIDTMAGHAAKVIGRHHSSWTASLA